MDRFSHLIVSTEGKRYIGYATGNHGMGKILLDPFGRLNKIDRIIIVLFNTGSDSENIGIENNVTRVKAHLLGQDLISPRTDFSFALKGISLTLFIECHHNHGGAVTLDELGLLKKNFFAFFQRDRIDHAFALNTFQACFNHFPL